MTPEYWKDIKLIVEQALEHSPENRSSFIDKACGGNLDMKKEVNSLLHFYGEVGEFLEKPVIPITPNNSDIKTSPINNNSLLNPGMVLQDRYLILEKVGQGGMGAVYKAQDKRLNNIVALKQIMVSGDRLEKAFEQEAQLLAKLRHPALPSVIDYFHETHGQFLVMEFITGDTLSELLTKRKKPFEMNQVISWAEQLLDVLNYLHSHNPSIIHRDIKPNNLKLTKEDQIVLLDFGLAKGLSKLLSSSNSNLESSIAGYTPHYASLEQINGVGTDCRSDIYSLAATLYHLVTYSKPPDATFRATAILNKEADPLKPAHLVNSNVSLAFAQLLNDCLSPNIKLRPSSAKALLARLSNLEGVTESNTNENQSNDTLEQSQIETLIAKDPSNTIANTAFTQKPFTNHKVLYAVLSIILLLSVGMVTKNSNYLRTRIAFLIDELDGTTQMRKTEGANFGKPGFKGELITVDIKEITLYDMLRFFSDSYGLNFVVDKSVPDMIVTMKVNDIPWGDALASVLETNNLTYKVENSVVRIVPANLSNIEQDSINKKLPAKELKK